MPHLAAEGLTLGGRDRAVTHHPALPPRVSGEVPGGRLVGGHSARLGPALLQFRPRRGAHGRLSLAPQTEPAECDLVWKQSLQIK